MEIDTGAVVSVVGNAFYEKYLPHVPLGSFTKQLHSYSGEVLATKGEILVDVEFKGQKAKLPLVIVDGDKPALLGRNWLMEIKLDWNQLFVVNYGLGEELVKKYKNVFDAQHGVLKGYKADLLLKKDADIRKIKDYFLRIVGRKMLELEEDAKDVLTINTHKGLFRIERLNFGVASAPAIFQSVMDRVLSGVKNVVCYLDDILITTRSIEEHKEILSEVLQRLESHNIKLLQQILPSGNSQEGKEPSMCQVRFTDSLPISAKDIQQETGRDPLLSRVLSFVLNGWPEACGSEELRPYFSRKLELSAEQGCVLWGTRVEEYLKSCESCQMFRNKPAHAPLHPWKFPARAWQKIHMDYGMFDKQMLLIVIDSYSKWIEVHEMSSTTSGETIDKLSVIPPKETTEELPVIPDVLPPIELEKTFDETVIEDKDFPNKKTPEKEELQIESEAQKTPDVSLRAKTSDVSLPAKTPERRYPARIRRPPRYLDLDFFRDSCSDGENDTVDEDCQSWIGVLVDLSL
eukprot:gene11239-21428_t